jgi:hypothetical protein
VHKFGDFLTSSVPLYYCSFLPLLQGVQCCWLACTTHSSVSCVLSLFSAIPLMPSPLLPGPINHSHVVPFHISLTSVFRNANVSKTVLTAPHACLSSVFDCTQNFLLVLLATAVQCTDGFQIQVWIMLGARKPLVYANNAVMVK